VLDLIDRDEMKACEILLLLADNGASCGSGVEAISTLQQVESIGRSRGFSEMVARSLLACVDVVRDTPAWTKRCTEGWSRLWNRFPDGDGALRARLLGAISFTSFLWRPAAERLVLCDEATAMARRLGKPENHLPGCWHSTHFTIMAIDPIQTLDRADEMVEAAGHRTSTSCCWTRDSGEPLA